MARDSNGTANHGRASRKTRKVILEKLKREGEQSATALSNELKISSMAVRQHLYDLQQQKLVHYREAQGKKGRPTKLWHLTETADCLFPDAHSELAVSLIDGIREAFGAGGMERLLQIRAKSQTEQYRSHLRKCSGLAQRLERLAALRSAEGYMAETRQQGEGEYLLIENHCPICSAAASCTGLCANELEIFQTTLGKDVVIERTEHIMAGARRCAYRVKAKIDLTGGS